MGRFRQPFRGDYPITLNYHEKFDPLYDNVKRFHEGIDYGCPEGTPILASADGTVVGRFNAPYGYGLFVEINHGDGYHAFYAHLSRATVDHGDKVSQGDLIGYSGNTGNSTGPHLHFEVRKNGASLDPRSILQSVFDADPANNTPEPEKPHFEAVESGFCMVVCDVANVRCHCDMSRVVGTLEAGSIISVGDEVTIWNGLPFRDYYDPRHKCWLRIAEHDPDTQMIVNYDLK